ncbi:hypothetical protein F5B20DRAFT_579226 [Whalleya microplaca]|nr:hypothetical protein F5B20DRAFT_579226 [Whalleya microplaca]
MAGPSRDLDIIMDYSLAMDLDIGKDLDLPMDLLPQVKEVPGSLEPYVLVNPPRNTIRYDEKREEKREKNNFSTAVIIPRGAKWPKYHLRDRLECIAELVQGPRVLSGDFPDVSLKKTVNWSSTRERDVCFIFDRLPMPAEPTPDVGVRFTIRVVRGLWSRLSDAFQEKSENDDTEYLNSEEFDVLGDEEYDGFHFELASSSEPTHLGNLTTYQDCLSNDCVIVLREEIRKQPSERDRVLKHQLWKSTNESQSVQMMDEGEEGEIGDSTRP